MCVCVPFQHLPLVLRCWCNNNYGICRGLLKFPVCMESCGAVRFISYLRLAPCLCLALMGTTRWAPKLTEYRKALLQSLARYAQYIQNQMEWIGMMGKDGQGSKQIDIYRNHVVRPYGHSAPNQLWDSGGHFAIFWHGNARYEDWRTGGLLSPQSCEHPMNTCPATLCRQSVHAYLYI